jgi:hypothetical protein
MLLLPTLEAIGLPSGSVGVAIGVLSFSGLVVYALWTLYTTRSLKGTPQVNTNPSCIVEEKQNDPYLDIQPLPDFNWATTSPIRNSPLKPKYHLTMGIVL